MHLHDQIFEDARYEIQGPETTILGRNLVFRRCHLILRTTARSLVVGPVQFLDSRIELKKPLKNVKWSKATIEGCVFVGRYEGCDFGSWPELTGELGDIRRSDLTSAVLVGCRFFNCSMDDMHRPRWPSFTVMRPREMRSQIESLTWAPGLGMLMGGIADSPEGTVAVCEHAPSIADRYKLSLDELQVALQRLPGVVM